MTGQLGIAEGGTKADDDSTRLRNRDERGYREMALIKFMASPVGRGARIILGLVLIVLGFGVIGGTGGIALGVVGVVPIAMGVLNACILAPVFGCSLRGAPR